MRKGQFYDLETYVPEVKVKQEELNDEEWASNQNKPKLDRREQMKAKK